MLIHIASSKPAPITRRESYQGTLSFLCPLSKSKVGLESPGKPTNTLCLANLQTYVQPKPHSDHRHNLHDCVMIW